MSPSKEIHPTEMISAYLDGAAGPQEQVQVEEHLRICPRCREMVEDFHILAAATAREEPPPLPPDLAARIRRRMEEEKGRRSPAPGRTWQRPFAMGVAAGLAVATLVWLAVRQQAPASFPLSETVAQKPAATIAPSAPEPMLTEGDRDARSDAKKEAAPAGTRTKAGEMGSLGYVQGGSDKANSQKDKNQAYRQAADEAEGFPSSEEAALGAKQDAAPVPGGVRGAAPSAAADDSRAARSDGPAPLTKSKEKRSASRALEAPSAADSEPESALHGAATGPRSLVYETEDISVTFSEEGMVTLVMRGYACSASVTSPAEKESEFSPAPELASLFTRASSREIRAAVAPSGTPAAPPAEDGTSRMKSLTLRNPRGGTIYTVAYGNSPETAPPQPVLELEEEIQRQVGLRFRKALEDSCGPIPGGSTLVGP